MALEQVFDANGHGFVGDFGDARLKKSAFFFQRMVAHQGVCLRKLGGTRAGEVRFGRWLANKKVMTQEIISYACQRTAVLAVGRQVLAIHDTSELNYQAHAGRVRGMGNERAVVLHPN